MAKLFVHPYIPNSAPDVKEAMLKEIGAKSVEELFEGVPKERMLKRRLNLPKPASEFQVRRIVEGMLAKNKSCNTELLSFLGAGCWPHYVPAVCDEINGRSEFVTAYDVGETYSDLGRFQALFEFQSMIGELLDMDVVSVAMYDWASVGGEAARMASRVTGRYEILVPKTICPERLSTMQNYCERLAEVKLFGYDRKTGELDLNDLKNRISSKTAAVYFENPSYLGLIEPQGEEVAKIAHEHGALSIVGVEPTSLGILAPPGEYGADIVVGEGQPLGVHMNYGGGVLGILACRDEERLVSEMPSLLLTIAKGQGEGEYGFTWYTLPERVHYFEREKGKSFTGSSAVLWGITAAVYMALMGPQGMRELGEAIMLKSHYAMKRLSEIGGLKVPVFDATHFEEFTVDFNGTGKTVPEINKALLRRGIQGGKDITKEFPELGKSALYCVTEVHTQADIDRLSDALQEVVR